jgi:hypothetical protein
VKTCFLRLTLAALAVFGCAAPLRAFDLQFTIVSPETFLPGQIDILNTALSQVERFWESRITGYAPGISIASVPISINATTSGLASASFSGSISAGGYNVTTSGFVNINIMEINNFANWQGDEPNGLNFIDELLAHEVGHALGIGTQWANNGVYVFNSFQYTGQHGAAAYAAEFNDSLLHAPVENAGNPGTPNAHWDQLMRSSVQEGTGGSGGDPFQLDPRVGVTDPWGRDRGLELMTGAIDPDWREPFVARFTIQSLRDLGYTVTEFEDVNGDGLIDIGDRDILLANIGTTGLQIDSMTYGDIDRDRDVDMADLVLWQQAAGVPEPGSAALAALAMLAGLSTRRRSSPVAKR